MKSYSYFLLAVSFLLSLHGNARTFQTASLQSTVDHYYGQEVRHYIDSLLPVVQLPISRCSQSYEQIAISPATDNLKNELHKVIAGAHITEPLQFDRISESCDLFEPTNNLQACKIHRVLGYKRARIALFGDIHLQIKETQSTTNETVQIDLESEDQFFIKDIYCLKNYTNEDLPGNAPMGRNLIPDHNTINAEHVWPQSRFKDNVDKETGELAEMKKSDLHILYPSDNKVNSLRSNYEFADVAIVKTPAHCSTGKLGYINEENTKLYFEPPQVSKGNVARSIFYFSTRYNVNIDEVEESFLRQWHESDPVDFIELLRNTKIYELQNVRNPFIDFPHLVKHVKNF